MMGFTLIEMMVVIGIIAILSSFIVPGFKKAYDDFKIRETYAFIDDMFSFQISSYLIYSEWPMGANDDAIPVAQLPFLSQQIKKFFNLNSTDYYQKICRYRSSGLYKSFYLFPNNRFIAYAGHVRLCDRPKIIEDVYYFDDLLERYRRKGCKVYQPEYYVFLTLPGGSYGTGDYENYLQYR